MCIRDSTNLCPAAFARAETIDVLPTPGEPSNKIGFRASCNARRSRATLRLVDGAVKANSVVEGIGCVPQLIVNEEIPNRAPSSTAQQLRRSSFSFSAFGSCAYDAVFNICSFKIRFC